MTIRSILAIITGEASDPRVLDTALGIGRPNEALYLTERPGGTGAQILETVDVKGAGLLVMGAYTHSRWREMVLGGVTQHIIQNAALPVLFAH
jgi:nucleotide-binding universal stress UspA family protein